MQWMLVHTNVGAKYYGNHGIAYRLPFEFHWNNYKLLIAKDQMVAGVVVQKSSF